MEPGEAAAGDRSGQDLHARRLGLAEAGQRADEGPERVDLVRGAQRVVLGQGQGEGAAGGDPIADEGRGGRDGLGARPGPGGLDRPLDQARRDLSGYPEGDGEPAVGAGELEAEVGLSAEEPSPGRSEEGDQIGPQGGRPLRVDVGRGEDLHQPGAVAHPGGLDPARHGHRDQEGQGDAGGGGAEGDGEVGGDLGEVVDQPVGGGAGVGQVVAERPGGRRDGLGGGHRHASRNSSGVAMCGAPC